LPAIDWRLAQWRPRELSQRHPYPASIGKRRSGWRQEASVELRMYPLRRLLMKSLLSLTAIAIVLSGPALAAGKCSTSPKSRWQPQSNLEAQLASEGFKVRQVKVENGCYEVYATNKDGKRENIAFNAETLERLDNAEAGEN
jgi:hypothetical protein